jgi:hypothetical protein
MLHTVSFRQWQTAPTPGSEPGVYRSTTDILGGGFCGLAEGTVWGSISERGYILTVKRGQHAL